MKNYYSILVENAEGNQNKTWKVINEIMGRKRKPASLPSEIISYIDNTIIDKEQDVGEHLNQFFSSIGKKSLTAYKQINLKYENFMTHLHQPQSMYLNPLTEAETFNHLMKIRTEKSYGPDGLHPRFIKDIGIVICSVLTHIINISFTTGIVPEQMKISRVTPTYKGGSTDLATNYRPISILSTLAKVTEALI